MPTLDAIEPKRIISAAALVIVGSFGTFNAVGTSFIEQLIAV